MPCDGRRLPRPASAWPLLFALAGALALAACGGGSSGGGPSCSNGVKDGDETDVDCGGSCGKCADGRGCGIPSDCASGVCTAYACAAPTCSDGVRNGGEAGVDCGGPCAPCGSGLACTSGADCVHGVCLDGACDCGDATAVHVSAANGSDASAGTAAAPLQTIQAAVACAYKVPREIRVAAGTYLSSSASRVLVADGKSLVGGWSADFAVRDPGNNVSTIQDTTDTGNPATPTAVAVVTTASSPATVLEGFAIQATTTGAGQIVNAIQVGSPGGPGGVTIRGNAIRCGGDAGLFLSRCIDLGAGGATVVVSGNAIQLGTAGYLVAGVHGLFAGATTISGNAIGGGSGATVTGIELSGSFATVPLVVDANDVRPAAGDGAAILLYAGTAAVRNNVVVVPGAKVGIDDQAGAEISNNTVVAAAGTGIRMSAAGARVRNNAVSQAGGTCLAEAIPGADPALVQENDLWGCATIYLDEGTTALTLGVLNAGTPVAGASGNLSADPLLDAAKGYRPQAGSPLLGAGLDLSSLFTDDRSGATRTAPWTIGAYQAP